MTQLADTLFDNVPLTAWQGILNLQSSKVSQLTYSHGQFNISEQKLQVSNYFLSLIGNNITSNALINLLRNVSEICPCIEVFPFTTYPNAQANTPSTACVFGFESPSKSRANDLRAILNDWSQEFSIDFALTPQLPTLTEPGIVLMDMDSTTIQIECIDEIAKLAGTGDEVAAVTARAMNGELDFSESLRSRVATLTACSDSVLKQVADEMPLMPGLKLLIETLHQANWKVAIASGGFTYFAQRLQDDLGFDHVYANQLEIIDSTLTGKVIGDIVDAQAKADILTALAETYAVKSTQTVAIGDGANDLLMLGRAAFGVAIHAKPLVQKKAQVSLNHHDLDGLVGLLQSSVCLDLNWS